MNKSWNRCKAVLVSWEGLTVSVDWIIDNEALLYLKSREVILHHKILQQYCTCSFINLIKAKVPCRFVARLLSMASNVYRSTPTSLGGKTLLYCKLSRTVSLQIKAILDHILRREKAKESVGRTKLPAAVTAMAILSCQISVPATLWCPALRGLKAFFMGITWHHSV